MSGNMSETIPAETGYTEMARRPLDPEQSALIVVDMQEKLLPPIWEKERLVRNVQLLIRLAGILKIPALVTTQYAKGLGNTVPDIAAMLPENPPVDKLTFSCFGSDVFCSLLKRLPGQRTTVLLCGMETHICVMQTAMGALREGYLVHLAADALDSLVVAGLEMQAVIIAAGAPVAAEQRVGADEKNRDRDRRACRCARS